MTTWMIVEDEPDLYDMLNYMVEGIGHNMLGFMDGETALEWIERAAEGDYGGEMPELALIDIRLHGHVHGPTIAAALRQHEATKHMIVVMMTAYRLSVEEETNITTYATPDLMLYKPLPPFPEFRRKLEDLLM